MKVHNIFFVCLSILLIVGLSACAPSIAVESHKYQQDIDPPRRLFISLATMDSLAVPSNVWQPAHDETEALGTGLVNGLQKCGVAADYHKDAPLSFDSEVDKLNKFSPDKILRIVLQSQKGFPNQPPQSADYKLELIDAKQPRVIWSATLKLNKAWNRYLGQSLAEDILKKMQSDNLINASCVLSSDH